MSYDLSMLQKRINRSIDKCQIVDVDVYQLIKNLGKSLKKFKVKVQQYEVETDYFSITAVYNFEKMKIDMYICCNDDFMITTKDEFNDLKFEISSTIQHEYVHREQYLNNKVEWQCDGIVDDSKEHEYYSNPEEIQAYAHDIMLELSKNNSAVEVLRTSDAITLSDHYANYVNIFGSKNVVINKLLKHCYKFRNVKWVP